MKIYHNPRCKKSRETLERIREQGIEPEIVKYLEIPPSPEELKDILKKLDMEAGDIIRTGEKVYKENYKGKELSQDDWIEAIQDHPKLMQRPIAVEGDKAVIGRPPENVDELIG